jgi:hypothetical protein
LPDKGQQFLPKAKFIPSFYPIETPGILPAWPQACKVICRKDTNMPLIYIVLTLIVAGVILWLINTYIPMAGSIKTILNLVVVVVVCVWVLQAVGLWQSVLNYRIPTVHGAP